MSVIPKLQERLKPPDRIPLDNAAHFFAGTSTRSNNWVFRFTCELTETVDPWILQYATEDALKQYPLYRKVLHKGFFWCSLEDSKRQPIVREERSFPCRALYERHAYLQFAVTYFNERINLDVCHALSDGIGALKFFKLLIASYLIRKRPACGLDLSLLKDEFSQENADEDSYQTYYSGISIQEALKDQHTAQHGRSWKKRGYQLKGQLERNYKIKRTVGIADANAVVAKAHEYGATATVLLTAAWMLAIRRTTPMEKKHKCIVVNIPVNLRKYLPSESARNFFQAFNVGYCFHTGTNSFKDVVDNIRQQFSRVLTPEGVITQMNARCSLEHILLLRFIPRRGKDAILRVASILGTLHTTSISNLGQISMPTELMRYIRLFDFTTSTQRIQLNVCSYENQMVMDIASRLKDTKIQEEFFRILYELGITMTIPKA